MAMDAFRQYSGFRKYGQVYIVVSQPFVSRDQRKRSVAYVTEFLKRQAKLHRRTDRNAAADCWRRFQSSLVRSFNVHLFDSGLECGAP
jgi:hypothetical protein